MDGWMDDRTDRQLYTYRSKKIILKIDEYINLIM